VKHPGIPSTGVGDTDGVRSPGGGLQVGVTLNWDAGRNVSFIIYIHRIYLTKVTFILVKDSKSKTTNSPF